MFGLAWWSLMCQPVHSVVFSVLLLLMFIEKPFHELFGLKRYAWCVLCFTCEIFNCHVCVCAANWTSIACLLVMSILVTWNIVNMHSAHTHNLDLTLTLVQSVERCLSHSNRCWRRQRFCCEFVTHRRWINDWIVNMNM